jgi:hypothetical protein
VNHCPLVADLVRFHRPCAGLCMQEIKVAANEDIQQWIDREFFEADIDSESCAARWYAGEKMDWQAAVSALF